jgi:hypothetical protein
VADLKKIKRGKAVRGGRKLAVAIFDDPDMKAAVYGLDRAEFGLQTLAGQLTGYSNWLDAVLAERASSGKRRRRARQAA